MWKPPVGSGDQIGEFEIKEELGAGGMGAVLRAYDTKLRRDVAIKFVQPRVASRFEDEAVILAGLDHPHIVKVFQFIRHGEH